MCIKTKPIRGNMCGHLACGHEVFEELVSVADGFTKVKVCPKCAEMLKRTGKWVEPYDLRVARLDLL